MMRSMLLAVAALSLLAGSAVAAPLGVKIGDYDFTFDVPTQAVYDYAGAAADHLYVNTPGHYAAGSTYTGALPVLPALPAGTVGALPASSVNPYPVYSGAQFAGNLALDMYFTANDGPYTNGSDTYATSLTGASGHLRITGWLATQGFPPSVAYCGGNNLQNPQDMVLLDITFDKVSLLARAGATTADLVEGTGHLNTLLGLDLSSYPQFASTGSTFFKFIAPAGIFPASYNPMQDPQLTPLSGRISGEAGVPEPASISLILLGGGLLLRKRRRA